MKAMPWAVKMFEAARVASADWNNNSPLFVYQCGKVGSSSVYSSLKRLDARRAVYHVHFLSPRGIDNAVSFVKNSDDPVLVHHLVLSQVLRRNLDRMSGMHLNVISLIRDPIARAVSDLFENIMMTDRHLVGPDGRIDVDGLLAVMLARLEAGHNSVDFAERWFDSEIKEVTGVDVFRDPFTPRQGWELYHGSQSSLLVVRLEDLNRVFPEAVGKWLGVSPSHVKLVDANIGDGKWYADDYRRFLARFTLTPNLCRRLYSTRFMRHFYRDRVDELTQKWTRGRADERSQARTESYG
jgi:hypothetical protein